MSFNWFIFMSRWNWLFSRFSSISALRAAHSGLSGNAGLFHPKLLISFISLSIVGSNWLAHLGGVCRIDYPYAEARRISSSIEQTLPTCSCALGMGRNFVPTTTHHHQARRHMVVCWWLIETRRGTRLTIGFIWAQVWQCDHLWATIVLVLL